MSKSTTVVKQSVNPSNLPKPKDGWKKTVQVLSNGQVRIIHAKVP